MAQTNSRATKTFKMEKKHEVNLFKETKMTKKRNTTEIVK